jgi:hypothetical protein
LPHRQTCLEWSADDEEEHETNKEARSGSAFQAFGPTMISRAGWLAGWLEIRVGRVVQGTGEWWWWCCLRVTCPIQTTNKALPQKPKVQGLGRALVAFGGWPRLCTTEALGEYVILHYYLGQEGQLRCPFSRLPCSVLDCSLARPPLSLSPHLRSPADTLCVSLAYHVLEAHQE